MLASDLVRAVVFLQYRTDLPGWIDDRATNVFVAAFRNRAEIVLPDLNRQSPKSAARPFPQGSHSLGRCSHAGLPLRRVWCTQNRSQGVKARGGLWPVRSRGERNDLRRGGGDALQRRNYGRPVT
jgi:hypothetical protein